MLLGYIPIIHQVWSTACEPNKITCSTRSAPVSASSSIECSICKQPQTLPSCHLNVCFCARVCSTHAYLYHYSWRSLFFLHTVNIILLRTLTISCITKKIRLNLQGGILVSFSVQVEEISSYFDGILLIDAADDC